MHLVNYLVRSEAPTQAFVASSAESALHRAPCLGGNTNGQAPSFLVPWVAGYSDGLYLHSISKGEHVLAGAIA